VQMPPKIVWLGTTIATIGIAEFLVSSHNSSFATPNAPVRYVKAIYSAPLTLDPAQMDDTASLAVSNLLYSGLLSFGSDLQLRGAIAESWSESRDGRTLRFKLRKDASFQNGKAITAQDVVRSLSRVVAPGSKVYSYYDCVVGTDTFHAGKASHVAGLRTPTADQVEIQLKYPFPPFLSVLAGATAKILPTEATSPAFFKRPIGSGAFIYSGTRLVNQHPEIDLKKFSGYFGEIPKIDELVLRVLDEKSAMEQAKAGLVNDLASYPLGGDEDVFRQGQDLMSPVAATWVIGLNTRLPPFNDLATRRAFRDSLDPEKFRKTFQPDAVPAHGYIPPGLPGYQQTYRLENAGASAGAKNKLRLIRIAIPDVLARSGEMKRFLEESLRARGWTVEVVPMEWSQLMKGYSDKSLQGFLLSMNMDYPDTEFLVRNFESSNPDNFSGLHDAGIDALIRKARATQDRVARQGIYVELVEKLREAAVTVDLFHPRGHYWASDCVRGLAPNLLADVYIDYKTVTLDPACSGTRMAGRW
jgi:oligopeptide transport system substrate-binding protein